jgi:tRNA-dihydrouridine synthase B
LHHLADHYAFYGEEPGVRIARKHLAWYTNQLAGGDDFRREINTVATAQQQLTAVGRFFDRLAGLGERLDYRAVTAHVVDASSAFVRPRAQASLGGEALAA